MLGALFIALPGAASAQGTLIDEGTFALSINGASAGSEHFVIRRTGPDSNPQYIATAEITLSVNGGTLDLRPALQVVGSGAVVSAYQVKISGSRQEEVYLTRGDERFLIRTRSDRGERERELRGLPGSVLLDTYVAHHYHFLVAGPGENGGRIHVIVPTEGREYEMPLAAVGPETIDIGGRAVETRHLRLGQAGSGQDVWVDQEGRVMRVELPSTGYAAVRTEPPGPSR